MPKKYHNPEQLTQKDIGKSFRFLLEGELPQKGDQFISYGNWVNTQNWKKNEPASTSSTYRTKRPLPKKAKEKTFLDFFREAERTSGFWLERIELSTTKTQKKALAADIAKLARKAQNNQALTSEK